MTEMLTTHNEEKVLQKETALLSFPQKQAYQHDGFLILKNFIAPDICQLLMQRARYLIEQFDPNEMKIIFSTFDQQHEKSNYFLDSSDKIRFFFEENAIGADGQLKTEKLFCINKIGHALHDVDPVFNCFSRLHKIAALAKDLDVSHPLLIQSMYICKQPYIGGEVVCHQDASYLFVKGQPVTGLWFALEDATIENGCLWAIPGGHQYLLKSRTLRDMNDHLAIEIYDDTPWPLDQLVPLEVPAGSLIVLHGLLPHMSKENTSSHSRHSYILHIMSSRYEYAADNWLQRPKQMPFKGFI